MTEDDVLLELIERQTRAEQGVARMAMHATVAEYRAADHHVRLDLGADPQTGRRVDQLWVPAPTLGNKHLRIRITPHQGMKMLLVSPGGRIGEHSVALFGPFNPQENPQNSTEQNELRVDIGGDTHFLVKEKRIEGRVGETRLDLSDKQGRVRHGRAKAWVNEENAAIAFGDQVYLYCKQDNPPRCSEMPQQDNPPKEHD